jgi:pimeloyl-ACP methyl ester carboxylesterase
MARERRHFFTAARWTWRLVIAFAAAILIACIALLVWARQVAAADATARFAMDSDDVVAVSRDDWIVFRPGDNDPSAGFIFYPGGKAEPAAYAPLLRDLAAQGYLVVMTPMPLNLALLAPERAARVFPRFPEIRTWVIAGHSLGGVMAAEFAERHPEDIAGLVLWASYPADFSDLSGTALPVLSVSGTADALTTPGKIEASRRLLPPDTRFVAIAGGDHWNFGDFAPGQGTAQISRHEQQDLILQATGAFLQGLLAGRTDEAGQP